MEEQDIIRILDTYFNREAPPKFINVSRIPLICQDISTIRDGISDLKIGIDSKNVDHEERIRKLEQNMWRNAGIASILGALGMWALQRFV